MRGDEVKKFLEEYSSGNYSEADHKRFIDWLGTVSQDEVDNIINEYGKLIHEAKPAWGNVQLISHIESALDRYEADQARKSDRGKLFSLQNYLKLSVAVAVLTLVVAGTFLLFKKNALNQQTATMVRATGILPGGNKAMLTLADGTSIVLDSAANGNLANQGKTTVIKLDGQLSYSATGNSDEVLFNTISTPKGGQYQLVLADGSKVWLNAASSLRFPTAFTGNERSVELTGEAYFEVSKDPVKRFKVIVNGMDVEVLGTHFNINSYRDERAVMTTLLEGSVKISNNNGSRLLKPGQQGKTGESGELVVLNDVDVDQVMAWKNGEFNFNNADLETVMRQLSRWYDVDIVYEGKIPKREFGGEIQRDLNLSEVLKLLQKNNVHFRIEGKKLVVMP